MIRFIIMIVMGTLFCGVAAADPGQEHSARGQVLYREGRYREAHDEFAAGYEASKLAAFVFNMAECSRLAGNFDAARDEYAKYLALDPHGKLAPLVNQRLAALPARTPRPTASPPSSTAPSSSTAPPSSAPAPATAMPSPSSNPAPSTAAPSSSSAAPSSPPAVPAPAVAAQRIEAGDPARPLVQPATDQPPPLWKRRSVWIAVGATLAAGTLAAIVVSRGGECSGTCIDWRKP